jgi:hypothetical protein
MLMICGIARDASPTHSLRSPSPAVKLGRLVRLMRDRVGGHASDPRLLDRPALACDLGPLLPGGLSAAASLVGLVHGDVQAGAAHDLS